MTPARRAALRLAVRSLAAQGRHCQNEADVAARARTAPARARAEGFADRAAEYFDAAAELGAMLAEDPTPALENAVRALLAGNFNAPAAIVGALRAAVEGPS